MGPRLFRRGNEGSILNTADRTRLQWGHVFSDVEISSDSPRAFAVQSFNGATSFQTWKSKALVLLMLREDASMGPRLFRRGNLRRWIEHNVTLKASMGPRLFRRGNTFHLPGNRNEERELQWGHVFSDVEIRSAEARTSSPDAASMGPRLFRRGNVASGASAYIYAYAELQWGHVFSDVEILTHSLTAL